jgi:hypothetical protein
VADRTGGVADGGGQCTSPTQNQKTCARQPMGPAQLQPLRCGDPASSVVDAQLTLCDLTCPPLNEPDPPICASEDSLAIIDRGAQIRPF